MAVVLEELSKHLKRPAPKHDPKYFHKDITGSGGKTGMLSASFGPAWVPAGVPDRLDGEPIDRRRKQSAGDVETCFVPVQPLTQTTCAELTGLEVAVPDRGQMLHLGTGAAGEEVFLDLDVQAMLLRDETVGSSTTRSLQLQYRYAVFTLRDGSALASNDPGAAGNRVEMHWSFNPMAALPGLLRRILGRDVDEIQLHDWLETCSVYDRICAAAETWSSDVLDQVVMRVIDAAARSRETSHLVLLSRQLRYLETYPVSLEAYKSIYSHLEASFVEPLPAALAKTNINLLLNQTLAVIDANRDLLARVPAVELPGEAWWSDQQRAAITTTDPLVLVQAGAGTGKSTTILERIKHLIACGVPADEITVLSFTNAAADNIREKNPDVHSMTIASMIHSIYAFNNPTHELSSMDTIMNSLGIYFPTDQVAINLARRFGAVKKNSTGATTELNNFVEENFARVMQILDKIGQTCLELEIILCYQRADSYAEPTETACRHLIIDEVQDNSIFEFIYFLKYVNRHRQSLYAVGDGSQTLYEFRAANPKALNTLEHSGVFKTYQLTTNYRSRQEILDFANVALCDIEANRIAKIQLQANSEAVPTAGSFAETVQVSYLQYTSERRFTEDLPQILRDEAKGFVDGCLERGEKVTFLAHTRRNAFAMQQALQQLYPTLEVGALIEPTVYDQTLFSSFIRRYWNLVTAVEPKDACFVVSSEIVNHLGKLHAHTSEEEARELVNGWYAAIHPVLLGWLAQFGNGTMAAAEFFALLQRSLLDHEIRANAARQSVLNLRRVENKARHLASDAPLAVSTIHGVKGLEFDNVVMIHRHKSRMEEDDKRMYYVALTRAINSELIISHGDTVKSRIMSDHGIVMQLLAERDEMAAQRELEDEAAAPDAIDEVIAEEQHQDVG